MTERTRMFKTLACLSIAMAGSAALLGWMEPPANGTLADPDLPRQLAAQAVAVDRDIAVAQWNVVEIASPPDRDAGGRNLSARPQAGHFVVSTDGTMRSCVAWKSQQRPSQKPATIVVTVEGASTHTQMPIAQWISLRALLAELFDRAGRGEYGLEVRLDAALVNDAPGWTQSLRSRLAEDGYSPVPR